MDEVFHSSSDFVSAWCCRHWCKSWVENDCFGFDGSLCGGYEDFVVVIVVEGRADIPAMSSSAGPCCLSALFGFIYGDFGAQRSKGGAVEVK